MPTVVYIDPGETWARILRPLLASRATFIWFPSIGLAEAWSYGHPDPEIVIFGVDVLRPHDERFLDQFRQRPKTVLIAATGFENLDRRLLAAGCRCAIHKPQLWAHLQQLLAL